LIDVDGSQLGIKALPDALRIAKAADLDLVEVADQANPPVCRIMDYNKYKYEAQQRAKESRKKSTNVVVKEMKYRPKIGIGDFDTKTRKVAEFLSEGHKVKVTIMFRGREVFHPELGAKILDQIAEQVTEVGKVETQGRLDGRNMTMVLAPDKKRSAPRKQDDRGAQAAEQPVDRLSADGVPVPAEAVPAQAVTAPQPAAVSTDTPSA
jgi:translation initiation factor IF-3